MNTCDRCGAFYGSLLTPKCTCRAYYVTNEDDGGVDLIYVRGGHEQAATKWADENDCYNEHYLIETHHHTVLSVQHEGSKPKWFHVTGEAVPTYYAEEVAEPKNDDT